eukprot:Amastigsp_a1004_210.p2 type:complete len:165 gc:universal Amastigsp_a1004_210:780-286(-)
MEPEDVRHDVVGKDKGRGEEEPEHACKEVLNDKDVREDDKENRHVRPSKLRKLVLVVALTKRDNEHHKPDAIKGERNERVVVEEPARDAHHARHVVCGRGAVDSIERHAKEVPLLHTEQREMLLVLPQVPNGHNLVERHELQQADATRHSLGPKAHDEVENVDH